MIRLDLLFQGRFLTLQFPESLIIAVALQLHGQVADELLPAVPLQGNLILLTLQLLPPARLIADIFIRPVRLFPSQLLVGPGNAIFPETVPPQAVFHLPLQLADTFQLPDPLLNALQHPLQILVAPHILFQRVNTDILLVQHIGVHEILDIMDGLKSQRLGDQREKFILQTSETGQHQLPGLGGRGGKGRDVFIGGAKSGNPLHPAAVKENPVLQRLILHQIPGRVGLLLLRSRIHDRPHDKGTALRPVEKFQGNVGRQFPRALKGPVLPSCLAADIAVQVPFPLFMGRHIEMGFRTYTHKLYCIKYCGFSSPIFAGEQHGARKSDGLIPKPVPVDQTNLLQSFHCPRLLSGTGPAARWPA